ncbi:MAG: hypothetical protein KGH74_01905 [Candidatus Micrarchaeota archaeon]|nr:hypothetical protein [Candidatus Micrarchaeota archaeon]
MQNVFVISHSSDIDGVGSAALIGAKYGVPSKNMLFTNYSKESVEYVEKEMKKRHAQGMTLFLADLGVNERIIGNFLRIINSVKRSNGTVIWFDHHPWTKESIRKLAGRCDVAIVGENKDYCATEIAYKELGLRNWFLDRFVGLVHYSDFNLKPKDVKTRRLIGTYALSIASYEMKGPRSYTNRMLRHIVDVISSSKFTDKRIESDARRFDMLNKKRTNDMLKELYIRRDFALGFSNDVQTTDACMRIIERSNKNIGMYINLRTGTGHLRALKGDYSELARKLGGGGHPKAAGFYFSLKEHNGFRKKIDREKIADLIQSTINEIYD